MSSPATSSLHYSSTSPSTCSSNGLPSAPPSNSQIEAVIQMATSSAPADPRASGRDTRTQLFVGNLPYRVRWQDLKDLFRKSGTVLRADVSLGPDNRSRGYGTVLLATAEDAARAVEMFNGYNWQTRTLEVRPDRLPPDFDNQIHLASNPNSLPTSSAAPAFPLPVHPIPFTSSLGDHPPPGTGLDDFDASKLFGGDRPRTGSGAGSRSLFVGNLPFHCQWQDLKDLFRQGGTIVRADVALGPDGRSRGFGTVSFANDSDAERALNIFNGYEYNGRILKVHYDKYSQGQPSQSPVPPHPFPASSPHIHHGNPNVPTHIPIPMPPPLSAFELASGHQSPSSFDHPFGQISPYDLFPPHIAAIAANATAQAYMNKPPRSPPAAPPNADPFSTVSMSTASAILSTTGPNRSPPSSDPGRKATEGESGSDTTPPAATQTSQTSAPSAQTPHNPPHNPPHPGPIALPSPPINPFPHASGPMSPSHGLPPITPSMPTFTFVPQNATPPLSAHFLSPGVGLTPFSPPGTISPGAFYHPAPNMRHPLGQVWNVAPGAPVTMHSPMGSPSSPGFYATYPQASPDANASQGGVGLGMSDYFSVPPPQRPSEGYFPPVSTLRASGLSKEILKDPGSDSDLERKTSDRSVQTATTSDGSFFSDGSREGRTQSSVGTSLEGGDVGAGEEMAQSLSALSLDPSEEALAEAPAPHRTHSDGANATTPSTSGLPSGSFPREQRTGGTQEWPDREVTTPSERRASWTPDTSRMEFRRGLPA